jgi:DeoR family fructose operon transcriptional repressor
MIRTRTSDGANRQTTMKISNYRHRKILEMLCQRQSVSADELAAEFGVSKITIRRDLDTLAGENLLERTRGGAVLTSGLRPEELFDQKDHLFKREKSLIGRYAASLVAENETVFVNAGSTTLEVIRHLLDKKVRIVTNNAACLGLDIGPDQELILLGGDYRAPSKSLVGDMAITGLRSIFSSATFLGINGVNIKKGCTSAVHQETAVNKAMIENSSGKVIIVADHTKMNCVSSFLTCPLNRIDMIVTDWMTPPAFCEELEALDLSLVRVPDED